MIWKYLFQIIFSSFCNKMTCFYYFSPKTGGWTLIKRTVISPAIIDAKPSEFITTDDYASISNYSNSFLFPTIDAINKLQKAINFHQLRWYCYKKNQGSVFHVMSKNNSAGHRVLSFFLKSSKKHAEACDSFVRLPDDNSTLSKDCQKWGYNGTSGEINQWGYFNNNGQLRIYRNVTVWVNGRKAFSSSPPGRCWCDDLAGKSSLTDGDIWELYCR